MLWSTFVPYLAPYAAACPNPLLEAEARRAAIRFFRRTRAWVEWLDPVLSLAGKAEYDMDVPTGADVVRVERATLGDKPLPVLSFRDAPRDFASADLANQGLLSANRKTFVLGNAVAAGLTLQVQVALAPGLTSTGLPDDLFELHGLDIANGALAVILAVPGVEFYQPDLAMRKGAHFEAAINTVSVDAWRGFTASTPRVKAKFC
jgi:hypothetical protein